MSKVIQYRGGTTDEHSSFTGADREITVDTDKNIVVVHDGTTEGGIAMARQDMSNIEELPANVVEQLKGEAGMTNSDTEPSDPTEDMIWHDTENNVLKTYVDGDWALLGGTGSNQTLAPELSVVTVSQDEHMSTDITIENYNSDITYVATSNNEDIATVSITDDIITITGSDVTEDLDTVISVTAENVGVTEISDAVAISVSTIYVAMNLYGLNWNQSDDTYARTGDDNYTAIQENMRRCLLNADGTVNYYLDKDDSAKKEDGSDAVLTGDDGDVMVEIPKFWHKYEYADDTHKHSIGDDTFTDAVVHPAFFKDGNEVDFRYLAAYEMNENGRSLADSYPHCDQTRDEARTLANSNGTGWHLENFNVLSAVQLLMMIELGTMRSQEAIGEGRTQLSDGSWEDGSYYGKCGTSNQFGNGTGNVEYDGDADDAEAVNAVMSYRGIENLYGNVWTFVDGININDHVPYISNKDADFEDDVFDGDYVSADVTMPSDNGWQGELCNTSKGMFPSTVDGSDTTDVSDYYYQNDGARVLFSGGNASDGSRAGAFSFYAYWAASASGACVGSRSCF